MRCAHQAAAAVSLFVAACAHEPAQGEADAALAQPTAQIQGYATYRERMALPAAAVFEATLEDVSRPGADAAIIASTRIENPGNPPIVFAIAYPPARIRPTHRYTVRGRITLHGKLLFTSGNQPPELIAGSGNEVRLMLRRVGAHEPSSTLEKTYWKLTHLRDRLLTADDWMSEPHIVLHPADHRVSGSGGCNRITGSYRLDGGRLTFGQIAGTMMACARGAETEREFLSALQDVRQARVSGERLLLVDEAGKLLARFDARYMK
jgi:putative lipoprotein